MTPPNPRVRRRRGLTASMAALASAALVLVLGLVMGLTGTTASAAPTAPADSSPTRVLPATSAFTVTGIDLHDGTIVESNGTYYLYGTEYGCGFQWKQTNTPWCGFGVSTSTDKLNWSAPTLLFSPNDTDPYTKVSWNAECGSEGRGCFNARMIQRSGWGANDGVWVLWFSAPADNADNSSVNAYYAMGCNGPAGPCGASAGAPYGTTYKPVMHICTQNGDLSITYDPGQNPVAICTMYNQTLAEEQLDQWGTNGTGIGSTTLAGLTNVESSGAYQDPATGTWIMTYSDPNCGYCEGDGTGYATAASLLGPWTAPANAGWAAPATGKRDISATSCGGQPDTVAVIDGSPYEVVDLWLGTANEAKAALHYEPLVYQPGGGPTWHPFENWSC